MNRAFARVVVENHRSARTEVALHRFRKSRNQPKSLRILAKAKQAAARPAISAKERPAKVEEFIQLCSAMIPKSC